MNASRTLLGAALFAAAQLGAAERALAGAYDGSRPLSCAVGTVVECDLLGHCEKQQPDGENLPKSFRIDVAGKTVTSSADRTSPLKLVSRVDGELILQGGENGRGWSATIDEETGRMAVAVVEDDYTFSLFGTCSAP
jgi:hypothetical protein